MFRLKDQIITVLLIPVILVGISLIAILHLVELANIKVNSTIRGLRKTK